MHNVLIHPLIPFHFKVDTNGQQGKLSRGRGGRGRGGKRICIMNFVKWYYFIYDRCTSQIREPLYFTVYASGDCSD
jgi:hypothetical protein